MDTGPQNPTQLPRPLSRAILALGSNLGDRLQSLRFALTELAPIETMSSIYETAPVGGPPNQRHHLNMVAIVHTGLDPHALLRKCLRIEAATGRIRKEWSGPRTLDIDLLFYDDLHIETSELIVPHPRYAERGYVLAPLFEVAPERCPKDWQRHVDLADVRRLEMKLELQRTA